MENPLETKENVLRIQKYQKNEWLYLGEHYQAYSVKMPDFSREYGRLKYLAINYAGMLSDLVADLLFDNDLKISGIDNKNNEFIEALILENNLKTQFYESAIENSYRGDALFRIRAENSQCIIEDINPSFWYANYNKGNTRKEPTSHNLIWKVDIDEKRKGLFVESHYKGYIAYSLYEVKEDQIVAVLDPVTYGYSDSLFTETGVDDFLVVHIPNQKINSFYYGIDDYKDLDSIFFAINNRMTKVDNILDKHGDPILSVPKGVLDENGEVNKQAFGVIEVDSLQSNGQKPEYIVWDAKLESAFAEIDALIANFYTISGISPALNGVAKDGGQAESGKALKFRLLRTLAKKHKKQRYYDWGIKDILRTAQEFSYANGLYVGTDKITSKDPEKISIKWDDEIVNDEAETVDVEVTKLEHKLTTQKEAVKRTNDIDDEEADALVEQIKVEEKENAPKFNSNPFLSNNQENE